MLNERVAQGYISSSPVWQTSIITGRFLSVIFLYTCQLHLSALTFLMANLCQQLRIKNNRPQ